MKNVEPYLVFNGNCGEAFRFYETVFGVEPKMMRYRDIPDKNNVPEADMDRVVHVLLPVSKAVAIMGSDAPSAMDMTIGNNISLTLNTESAEEAARLFEKLSAGGKVFMPLGRTFFAELYTMFEDRFGIQCMIMDHS